MTVPLRPILLRCVWPDPETVKLGGCKRLFMGIISPMLYYYLVINILTFILWGMDKQRAKTGQWRIAERFLLGMALLGGGIGALAGMLGFRHKTRKPRFWILAVFACVLHAYLILLML